MKFSELDSKVKFKLAMLSAAALLLIGLSYTAYKMMQKAPAVLEAPAPAPAAVVAPAAPEKK